MAPLVQYFALSAPLFAVVFVGYALARSKRWRPSWSEALGKIVFGFALPAMLFRRMSQLGALPNVDLRSLIAYFGGCLVVFALGRVVAARAFHLDGVAQAVFGLGGIFSNNVLLGLPLAGVLLGPEAVPIVAFLLVFHAVALWTLVTVSVEWTRHGRLSVRGLGKTIVKVLGNPIIAGIVGGTLFGLAGFSLPWLFDQVLGWIGSVAGPLALLALGMGLSQYGLRREWRQSLSMVALKLVLHPMIVWGLCRALQLGSLETSVMLLLASLSTGANVYLMALEFESLQGPVAAALVGSTALAAVTTPLLLSLLQP